jgi:hypothetical protein
MDETKTLNKFYAVRWYDSKYYTSVNHVDYVMTLFDSTKPEFYKFLVYELIETEYSFRELTLKLPFDCNFNRVSVNKLHYMERAKLMYHLRKLRDYQINQPHPGTN